jgi:L-ascorbate metabolism protein UlaG (beta-lactamase superfamily)
MDWWEATEIGGLRLVCTPARHFSGRSMGDRCLSLWCSWVIKGINENIFYSGDSGYGPHFKEIGQQYGPFDFTMLECGQYYKDWSLIHMLPEEAAQVAIELRSKVAMPIHWGAFTLAFHSWTEPVERFLKKAKELNVQTCTPRIGEVIVLNEKYPSSHWWKEYLKG